MRTALSAAASCRPRKSQKTPVGDIHLHHDIPPVCCRSPDGRPRLDAVRPVGRRPGRRGHGDPHQDGGVSAFTGDGHARRADRRLRRPVARVAGVCGGGGLGQAAAERLGTGEGDVRAGRLPGSGLAGPALQRRDDAAGVSPRDCAAPRVESQHERSGLRNAGARRGVVAGRLREIPRDAEGRDRDERPAADRGGDELRPGGHPIDRRGARARLGGHRSRPEGPRQLRRPRLRRRGTGAPPGPRNPRRHRQVLSRRRGRGRARRQPAVVWRHQGDRRRRLRSLRAELEDSEPGSRPSVVRAGTRRLRPDCPARRAQAPGDRGTAARRRDHPPGEERQHHRGTARQRCEAGRRARDARRPFRLVAYRHRRHRQRRRQRGDDGGAANPEGDRRHAPPDHQARALGRAKKAATSAPARTC